MPPSGVDYASEFLNGYAPEYVANIVYLLLLISQKLYNRLGLQCLQKYQH